MLMVLKDLIAAQECIGGNVKETTLAAARTNEKVKIAVDMEVHAALVKQNH